MPMNTGKMIIEQKLRKKTAGDVEILRPFWKFDHGYIGIEISPLLLVYADLMATGDDRNIETAGIIYDNYLAQPDRQIDEGTVALYSRSTESRGFEASFFHCRRHGAGYPSATCP